MIENVGKAINPYWCHTKKYVMMVDGTIMCQITKQGGHEKCEIMTLLCHDTLDEQQC